jgi:hypothetical protein
MAPRLVSRTRHGALSLLLSLHKQGQSGTNH